MDLFSSREWALIAWGLLAIVFIVRRNPKVIWRSIKSILKAFSSRHIISVVALMGMYVVLLIFLLARAGLWEPSQLKNTLIWFVTIAAFSLFRINHYREDPHRLRELVVDNLKLVGIVEYLVGVYTFHLAVELILVPIWFALGAATAVSETRPNLQQAYRTLNGLIAVIALAILSVTLYLMVADFEKVASKTGVYEFIVPALLSAGYTPFIAFMVLYTTYQSVFVRLRYSIKPGRVHRYARLAAVVAFNVRINLLKRWAAHVAKCKIQSVPDVNQSIRQIFETTTREKNPPAVAKSEGWSPNEAKNFLTEEGISTGHYDPVDPENPLEWFCGSDMFEFGGGMNPNNIAYYLNGTMNVVRSLKLTLNVNTPTEAPHAHARFVRVADLIFQKAIGQKIPVELEEAVREGKDKTIEKSEFKVALIRNDWPSHAFGGYDLKLELSRV